MMALDPMSAKKKMRPTKTRMKKTTTATIIPRMKTLRRMKPATQRTLDVRHTKMVAGVTRTLKMTPTLRTTTSWMIRWDVLRCMLYNVRRLMQCV